MRRVALCAFVLLGQCARAPVPRAAPAPAASLAPVPAPDTSTALTRLCTGPSSIPMELAGSREFVMVGIPGAKTPAPLRFHVDTGGNTPGLMIRRSTAESLGFATAESMPRTIRLGDHDVALPEGAHWLLADDDALQLERATRKDFAVGQLGAGFLSRFVVCVDPGNARLGLGAPKDFAVPPKDAAWVPLFLLPGGTNHALYPFVHLLLLDHGAFTGGYGVLLDTGATTSMLDRNKIEYQHQKHPGWGFATGAFGDADMIGGQYGEMLLRTENVALDTPGDPSAYGLDERVSIPLGPATFLDRPTGTWSQMFGDVKVTMGSHGAIANDVLMRYRLVLDYAHARLFVAPSSRPPEPSASSTRVGVAVRFGSDGCPELRQVTDTNAPETRSKLHVGDVLEAIDGKNACAMFHHELSAALAGAPGSVKRLRLRRDGHSADVDVTTAELLVSH